MPKGFEHRVFVLGALALAAACTVKQSETPPLTGPSEFAQSVAVTANPDTIKLGPSATTAGESSQITVEVRDANGAPQSNKSVRLDLSPGNCGQLSSRDLTTGTDGRARTTFTAPGMPLPQPECANFLPGQTITVVAVVGGTDFQTSATHLVSIRMVAPTVITPPGAPTASYTINPNPAKVGVHVAFSDAGSAAAPGRAITGYRWDFSDGVTKIGPYVTHDFDAPGLYTATLTVTDDIGQQSFKSATVTITE
jgi:hypothetical protein